MTHAFQYKPRFKDIRIKPPREGEAAPEERVCEWPGCRREGACRAPKSNDRLQDFYFFCQTHAAEYNKSWNFFEGMSEGDQAAFRESATYGHRPTWKFTHRSSASAKAANASKDFRDGFSDPFGMFGDKRDRERDQAAPKEERRLGRLQEKALETMSLDPDVDGSTVRKRYAELVKRFHPDANGGDRSSEEQLGRVIAAYQILKNAGMA